MKWFFTALFLALFTVGAASAQRLQVGVRGGMNTVDYHFLPVEIGQVRFTPGACKPGFDAGLVVRLGLTNNLDIQSGANYAFVNYGIVASNGWSRKITVECERLEIPVELGVRLGAFRLFGGATFRLAEGQRNGGSELVRIDFSRHRVALMGGIGLNIKKFFLDLRVSGYPSTHYYDTFRSGVGEARATVRRGIVYGASMGFFF